MNSDAQSCTASETPNPGQPAWFPRTEILHPVFWGDRVLARTLWSPGYTGDTHHILIEVIYYHPGQARVTPVAMHKQELLEVAEAGNGEVTGHDSLRGKSRGISFQFTTISAPKEGLLKTVLYSRSAAFRACLIPCHVLMIRWLFRFRYLSFLFGSWNFTRL